MGTSAGAAKATAARAAARAELLASLEQRAGAVRVVASGVDTLELHTSQPLRREFVEKLEQLKRAAQAAPPGEPLPQWRCSGHVWDVKRTGSKRGSLLLEVPDAFALSLSPHAPSGLPSAMIEVRARHLWQDLDGAAGEAEDVLGVLTHGEHPEMQVSRVDVTCDWQGWTPEADLLTRFVTRARRDSTYRQNRRHTGWSWGGGGAVLCRVYDKSTEIRGTDKAQWFPKVWDRSGQYTAERPVWRAEYQVRREAIRELQPLGITEGQLKSWEALRPHLGSIFSTLSEHWCSLRLPRTKDSRQELDPRWEAIRQGARWEGCVTPVELERVQAEAEFSRTLDQLGAYVCRGIAERWALRGKDEEAHLTYEKLWDELVRHLEHKHQTIDGRAHELYEPLRVQAEAFQERRARRRARAA